MGAEDHETENMGHEHRFQEGERKTVSEERTACAMVWVRESAGVGYGDRYDCEQDRDGT